MCAEVCLHVGIGSECGGRACVCVCACVQRGMSARWHRIGVLAGPVCVWGGGGHGFKLLTICALPTQHCTAPHHNHRTTTHPSKGIFHLLSDRCVCSMPSLHCRVVQAAVDQSAADGVRSFVGRGRGRGVRVCVPAGRGAYAVSVSRRSCHRSICQLLPVHPADVNVKQHGMPLRNKTRHTF